MKITIFSNSVIFEKNKIVLHDRYTEIYLKRKLTRYIHMKCVNNRTKKLLY